MTWSIVARDGETGAFGVAVTTKFFAVGALCPHATSGVGALATQALVNPTFGPRGLRLLAEGVPAADIVRVLLADDAGRETRRLHDEAQRYFIPFSRFLPTKASPAGTYDRAIINAELARLQAATGKN